MKKLMRSTTDKTIAGICGGLGKYFNIDPVILRLIFLLSIFFGGLGLIVYIVMWLVVPEDKS